MLLEAQKGPESLQEALRIQAGNHRTQEDELRALIDSLRFTLQDTFTKKKDDASLKEKGSPPSSSDSPFVPISALKDLHIGSQRTESLLEALPPQLSQLEQGLGRVESEVSEVRKLLETGAQKETQSSQPLPERVEKPERAERGDQWESDAVIRSLEETQRTLGEGIRKNTIYNAVFTSAASVVTISALYMLLRGTG